MPVGKQLGKARRGRAVSRQSQAAHLPSIFGPRDTGEASQTDCETWGSGVFRGFFVQNYFAETRVICDEFIDMGCCFAMRINCARVNSGRVR
jgi:hypothetical protein